MLQPSTVHLCISRRCTAEKWIFKAPLSQNVFRQTLHCTRFLPVAGLINCVPKLRGRLGEPQWRLVGVVGLRPGSGLGWRGVFKESLSRLRLSALWEFSSASSSSSEANSELAPPLRKSVVDGDLLPVDILVLTRPGKEEATRLAAARELTETAAAMAAAEWVREVGGGGGGGRQEAREEFIERFRPTDGSLSEPLRREVISGLGAVGNALSPELSFLKSNGCMLWSRLSGDTLSDEVSGPGGEDVVVGGDIFKKLRGCFWCGDMAAKCEAWKAEGTVGGEGRRFGDIARLEFGDGRLSRRSRIGS